LTIDKEILITFINKQLDLAMIPHNARSGMTYKEQMQVVYEQGVRMGRVEVAKELMKLIDN